MKYKKNNQSKFINKAIKERDEERLFTLKWTIKAIFISAVLLGIAYYSVESEKNPHIFNVNNVIKKTGIRSKFMNFLGDRNILLLGVDANRPGSNSLKYTRSDTIIILNIDRSGKSINAISVPRDSKVYLSGKKYMDKINSAHALGGPELAVKTIEDTFGIDISNHIAVNYAGVKDFVREIGGVPITVEKRMYYRDRTAGLTIDLEPGHQILDANGTEGYLRFRHDAQGDIGRIKRQQRFLKAMAKRIANPYIVLKIPKLYDIMSKNIETDMNLFELSKLYDIVRKINPEEIKVATLPGKPSHNSNVSYWILNADETQEIINRLIYRAKPEISDRSLTVSLFYSPTYKHRIESIVDTLDELGFTVQFRTPERNTHSEIIAHTRKAAFSKIEPIKEHIPELKNCQYIVEPDENLYPYTDFTIILGE